jgi:hypothetical protein
MDRQPSPGGPAWLVIFGGTVIVAGAFVALTRALRMLAG